VQKCYIYNGIRIEYNRIEVSLLGFNYRSTSTALDSNESVDLKVKATS
jgi:hypothetical protein